MNLYQVSRQIYNKTLWMPAGIIITDGRSDNPRETEKQARLARKDGIQLFAIGVGQYVDQRELYNIASQPASEYVFEVHTYEALGSVKNVLAMKACEGR